MLNANRYQYLTKFVSENYCNNILEIGTNRGFTAVELLKSSLNKNVNYYGIDLFETMTPELFKQEASVETWPMEVVKRKLESLKIGTIKLYTGFSKDVLPLLVGKTTFDLIFVDGGHSYETTMIDIMYSLNLVSPKGVIFIDDYSDELPEVKQAVDELYCKMKKEILNECVDMYRSHIYRLVKLSWNS
jgi:predicted O-methyltransferase YrrM